MLKWARLIAFGPTCDGPSRGPFRRRSSRMASEVLSLWRETEGASGRDAELGALLREWDEARANARPRFAFVTGPNGVGKSHLFGLFRAAIASRAGLIFEAESPREARRPFGVFQALLTDILEHLSHA